MDDLVIDLIQCAGKIQTGNISRRIGGGFVVQNFFYVFIRNIWSAGYNHQFFDYMVQLIEVVRP